MSTSSPRPCGRSSSSTTLSGSSSATVTGRRERPTSRRRREWRHDRQGQERVQRTGSGSSVAILLGSGASRRWISTSEIARGYPCSSAAVVTDRRTCRMPATKVRTEPITEEKAAINAAARTSTARATEFLDAAHECPDAEDHCTCHRDGNHPVHDQDRFDCSAVTPTRSNGRRRHECQECARHANRRQSCSECKPHPRVIDFRLVLFDCPPCKCQEGPSD